jgi:hypothetical protein
VLVGHAFHPERVLPPATVPGIVPLLIDWIGLSATVGLMAAGTLTDAVVTVLARPRSTDQVA